MPDPKPTLEERIAELSYVESADGGVALEGHAVKVILYAIAAELHKLQGKA